jgi:hypothetical protein
MFFTDTGSLVPGIIARLLVVFESKSVSKNANTSLELHWNSPYSLEANKKSN